MAPSLWKEAARYIPDYWLVGKGFSYDRLEMISAFQIKYSDDLKWALVTGGYHNGWLSMLLCTGVIGAILCLTLLMRRHGGIGKGNMPPWNNSLLKRFHGVFLAAFTANAIVFFIVNGDVHVSFPTVFFNWAVLETLARADLDAPPQLGEEEPGDSESTYQEV